MGHAMRADTGTQSPDRIVVTLGGRAVATTNPDPMMVNTLQFSQQTKLIQASLQFLMKPVV